MTFSAMIFSAMTSVVNRARLILERCGQRLSSLAGDQRGVSAVEFALLLPLMLALYLGVVEVSQGIGADRKVIDAVRANKIAVVFSESTISPDPAKQVARETGAKYGGVLYVDSLSAADGKVPTYIDLLRVTSETIANGLAQ